MSASAWSTIACLATALGTLVLAVATFPAVRSPNLMARVAREHLAGFAVSPLVLSHPVHHN
jgi:hypothetical protein